MKNLKKNRLDILLLVLCKVFTKAIANTTSGPLDSSQRNEQAGICNDHSTMNDIHTINYVIDNRVEYTQPVYITFIYEGNKDSDETEPVIQKFQSQGAKSKEQLQASFIRRVVKYRKGRASDKETICPM